MARPIDIEDDWNPVALDSLLSFDDNRPASPKPLLPFQEAEGLNLASVATSAFQLPPQEEGCFSSSSTLHGAAAAALPGAMALASFTSIPFPALAPGGGLSVLSRFSDTTSGSTAASTATRTSNSGMTNAGNRRPRAASAKASILSNGPLLHRSCQQFASDPFVVKTALNLDPSAARKRAQMSASQSKTAQAEIRTRFVPLPQGCIRRPFNKNKPITKEAYSYPINIALNNQASVEVVAMLASAAPEVLTEQDGFHQVCPLSLALTTMMGNAKESKSSKSSSNNFMAVIDVLLTANPRAVCLPDRRHNLPLHIAIQHGAPMEIVRQLYCLYPEAGRMQNFHGETPLLIAQRTSKCPEAVLDFLQARYQ